MERNPRISRSKGMRVNFRISSGVEKVKETLGLLSGSYHGQEKRINRKRVLAAFMGEGVKVRKGVRGVTGSGRRGDGGKKIVY